MRIRTLPPWIAGLVAIMASPSVGAEEIAVTTARVVVAEAHLRAGDHGAALDELRLALRQQPGVAPAALHYNLALCLDRLGRHAEAVVEYGAFLTTPGDPWEMEQVAKRVADLKALAAPRVVPQAAVAPPPPVAPIQERSRRHWIAPALLGGVALGVAAALVGTHVAIGERADFLRRSGGCAPLCDPVELQDLQRRAHTVYGLAAGLGVVLAVDVGLWIDALLKERRLSVGRRSQVSTVRQRL